MPPDTAMAAIVERGRLIVGVSQTAYLIGFREPRSGDLVGFDIDLARQIAQAILGNPNAIQFTTVVAADRIPVVMKHDVDLVVAGMAITCERRDQVTFSTEYLTGGHRILVNRDSGYRSIDDLKNRKVCASNGSTPLQTIQRAASRPIPVGAESTTDCLLMLQQRQVDAVCTDDYILAGLAAQDPATEVVGQRLSDEPYGVAMARDRPELVRFVNAVLDRMRADGTWATLYRRWFDRLGPPPAPPPARYRD